MDSLNSVWQSILAEISKNITSTAYNTWFADCSPVELGETNMVIQTTSDFKRSVITSRFGEVIRAALREIFSCDMDLVVLTTEELEMQKQRHHMTEIPPEMDGYTFDRFVVGPSNKFAHAAAIAVAENPGKTYNPLFIYGNSGLGKTHLLNAIGHELKKNFPDKDIIYVKGDQFANELIEAIRAGTTVSFREKYRKADALLIDDIQFIAGKESTQEEFFHTFNTLHGANKQIILSSDRPPKDMDILEDRIRSRFEWGLLADIQSPDYETRIAILRKKQELDGYSVSDDVIEYIASNIKSNIRELEGALNKIIAYANLEKREINIDLAEQVLRDIISPNEKKVITPEFIIDTVADHFDITPSDIVGSKRSSKIVFPRQIAMYLCREMLDAPLTGIGKMMGDRDHTTVMHGIEKIEKEMSAKDSVRNTVDILKKKINPSK